jgi:outer membrane immunogenic protein
MQCTLPSRVYNWTGFYLGLNGGGVLGKTSWGSLPDVTSGNVSNVGGFFGGTIGYNLQAGDSVVLGAEADLDWSSLEGTIPATSAASCMTNCQLTMPWLATVRLRGGYSFGGVLPYLTGGVAISQFNASIEGTPFGTQSSDNLGWTLGSGVEFVITSDWRAKAEYLYMDLNGRLQRGPFAQHAGQRFSRGRKLSALGRLGSVFGKPASKFGTYDRDPWATPQRASRFTCCVSRA